MQFTPSSSSSSDAQQSMPIIGARTADISAAEPCEADEVEFLEMAHRSKELHAGWVRLPLTSDEYQGYLARMRRDDHYGFLLRHRERLVGVINLSFIVRDWHQSAEVGYNAFVGGTGRGFMTTGLRLVVTIAFEQLGLHRLEVNLQPENVRSRSLAQRVGFKQEGFSPKLIYMNGEWRDHERWALIAEDWKLSNDSATHTSRPDQVNSVFGNT